MAVFNASPGWFARFCSRHRLDPIVASATDVAGASAEAAAADTSLSADGVPQSVAVPPAVSMPMTASTGTDLTAVLMDTLTTSTVTTSQAMEMVRAIAPGSEESKTDAPSINEQVQQAAREHNEAALRAAAAKIGEAQASEDKTEETSETESDVKAEEEEEGTKPGDAVAEDEIFSLGLYIAPDETKTSNHSLAYEVVYTAFTLSSTIKTSSLGGSSTTTSTASTGSTPTSTKKKNKNKKKKTKTKTDDSGVEQEDDTSQLPLAQRLEVAAAISDTHAALLGLLGWSRLYVHTETILIFFQSEALPLLLNNVLRSRPAAAVLDNLEALLAT
ncbi:Hypothetical protein PHPALM_5360 [Phytophthora palmivora]|uniref:HTH CENPB-type domain-containing protein n=1 Tax=Phytophthora palmivora TaxID=4796 RepID=A0A2P4YHS9_9STRA|nr:Hypothetical protein PHPALM_5360 [Phytophthora palmivora]